MPITVTELIAAFRDATATEMADLLGELDRGLSLWSERNGKEKKPVTADKPKRGRPPKKAATTATATATGEVAADIPTADSYRLDPTKIVADRCQARRLGPDGGDKRWYPAVYHEAQCEKKPVSGGTLCATCQRRKEACEAAIQAGAKIRSNSTAGHWNGLITEAVPAWSHMLVSAWADEVKPVWHGGETATETTQTTATTETTTDTESATGGQTTEAETDAEANTNAQTKPVKAKTVKRRTKAATTETAQTAQTAQTDA